MPRRSNARALQRAGTAARWAEPAGHRERRYLSDAPVGPQIRLSGSPLVPPVRLSIARPWPSAGACQSLIHSHYLTGPLTQLS